MPKKFKGENTKAASAKERKAEKLKNEKVQKEKVIEDASWAEDDKGILKKNKRKDERENKAQELLLRKEELKRLELEESASLLTKTRATPSTPKVTQFTIRKQIEESERQAAAALLAAKSSNLATPLQLSENTNTLTEEVSITGMAGISSAALDKITAGIPGAKSDSPAPTPPRANMAAEFAKFSEETMASVKKEFPGAKLSTLKDKVRKLWQRSPRNPLNQQ